MIIPAHEAISDWSQCPRCAAENGQLGGGTGYADQHFNHRGKLWAVCSLHRVRWYVTRALLGSQQATAELAELPEVEGVLALSRARRP